MSVPYVWHPSQQAFLDRPPYTSDRVYDSKGFAVPAEYPYHQMMRDGYRHGARVNPEKDAYWTTELQDNPLGLANMHIRAEEQAKPIIARPASRSQAHPLTRNSYPPKSNGRHPLASSSTPIARDPIPTHLRHHDRGHMPEMVGQQGPFDAQPAVDYDSKRQQRGTIPTPTHRDRYPLRRSTEPDSAAYDRATAAYGGRPEIPANAAGFGESSASAYEQAKAGVSRRISNARPMERSRTMPVRSSRDADLEGPPPVPHLYHYGKEPGAHPRDFVPQDYLQEPAPQMMDGFGGDQTDLARVRDWVNDAKRHTVDGMEHMRPEEHYSNPRHGHPRETVTRHGSAPVSAQILPGSGHVGVNGMHEEPEEMNRYREQAPVNDCSSPSSSSGSDDEDDGAQQQSRKMRSGKGTPFPPAARRLAADHDEIVYGQDSYRSRRSSPYSGSSRSKRSAGKQSTHRSIGRRSFEREREREAADREAEKVTEGDESATSYEPSIFAKGPQIDYNSDGEVSDAPAHAHPPVTPERKQREYVSRDVDRSGSPYAPHHHAEPAVAQPQVHGFSSASGSSRKPTRSGAHERSPSYAPQPQAQAQNTTPARLAYIYGGKSASPSPQGHVRSASVQPQQTHYSSASQDVLKAKRRSPRDSRSPSPYPGQPPTAAGNEYFEPPPLTHPAVASNGTPTRHGHAHTHKSSSASAYAHAQAQTRTPTYTLETPTRDGRRRSSSRSASYSTPTHPSSHSHAHMHSTAAAAAVPQTRHVRHGLWNRRGDHLTETGYVVYCPPGRNFPTDLTNYPENAFMDHFGKIARARVENYPELPESVPKAPGRTPEKGYDSFIKYVLVPAK